MKICFMCDLHLPFDKKALQYDVLNWALGDINEKGADCIIFAGDVTCDGNKDVYDSFIQKMQSLNIPFLFIPGNSDLRDKESRKEIFAKHSPCENEINGIKIFAINDSKQEISDEQLLVLEKADDDSIVFMHHPIESFSCSVQKRLQDFLKRHSKSTLFYGHLHKFEKNGNSVSLQAMDPDKAIGETPCVTYYDTDTREISRENYQADIPKDIYDNFGISCYDTIKQIMFSAEKGLKNIELRPCCIEENRNELLEAVRVWRKSGGNNLSIHLPDVVFSNGKVYSKDIECFMELAVLLCANRLTQHVPLISLNEIEAYPDSLELICNFLAKHFNSLSPKVVIGVENMHTKENEKDDLFRRFGLIPQECILFMEMLGSKCRQKVGINFDIGHARNNFPFSQKYQISTWLSQIGEYAVGYHIHQVTHTNGKFNNHMAITDIYGKLINFTSLFKFWEMGVINKAPLIFEMRDKDAYEVTLKTFNKYRLCE